ncbi:enoyl-CoA hydratase/isomerase family protein [Gordonia sp. Z-3]|jgi:enoyl-CoA hydratase/carnithine racemase|uniref:Enoyl-CoA hydratase/isomerase family protein n=2 Tax=Gordonia TaxID=2053 RepID=A0A9X3I5X3_9ACTN|nr:MULTISPECIES: enoyl-CoA hydratase/isomerase family protein [Gordonia]MAU83195.1 enoyl-CoA hydratase [Gordonia sp. (in: high G+C Gram-positive bacteria)]MAU83607.1 enoyl-CoA hydratase [Gordonia sp. (in: high G+C Gram-positive bacteria)]MCF3939163.1 enoyl-CoA hydratase/isomerase family protein [Gordonia tangerina]MCX2964934.1 enoyl-CoA hydratase/isomerase family protein [Gordonia aquimaris]MED5801372.1 enoyl-CoA hydratase/isomerase family protein [Gordonia sp. Z-3]
MPFLSSVGDVTELYLGTEGVELDESNPENRFRLDWLTTVENALAEVAAEPTRPLIITATGKYFTNGLDTDHILAEPKALPDYLDRVHALFSTLLTLPVPTVAAINGHAFGAGAMFALCADHRLMRTERGFWSLPEVALGMPFPLGMSSLLRTRLADPVATEAMLTARRYSGEQARAGGIVEEAVDIDSLLARAREVAAERAPLAGPNLGEVKRNLRQPLIADLQIAYPRRAL